MSTRPLSTFKLPKNSFAALNRAGYVTVSHVSSMSSEDLAQDLGIPLAACLEIFSILQLSRNQNGGTFLPTQSAASMSADQKRFSSRCPPLDRLLSGGISKGAILEISGAPCTPKDSIALNLAKSFIEEEESVLFVDFQNMTSPAVVHRALANASSVPSNFSEIFHYLSIHTLTELMVFVQNLPLHIERQSKIGLVVLNYLTFPIQSATNLSFRAKIALLGQVKLALAKACAVSNISLIVTSQLATKFVKADGSAGTFDSGARAVLVPALDSSYLPLGRTTRILAIPDSRITGSFRMLSSPMLPQGLAEEEPYALAGFVPNFVSR